MKSTDFKRNRAFQLSKKYGVSITSIHQIQLGGKVTWRTAVKMAKTSGKKLLVFRNFINRDGEYMSHIIARRYNKKYPLKVNKAELIESLRGYLE